MASARDKPVSPKKRTRGAEGRGSAGRIETAVQAPPIVREAPRAAATPRLSGGTARSKVPRSTKRSTINAKKSGAAKQARKPRSAHTPLPAPHRSGVGSPGVPSSRAGQGPRLTRELEAQLRPDVEAAARSRSSATRHDEAARVMELHWGDNAPSSRRHGLVQRWVKRGNALLRHLAEHGAARHEYRADLKEGRFVWVDPEGRVSAEAHAKVLCSWSRSTSALSMAWADPLVREVGIARIDGLPPERDDVDEESAWRVAMQAADGSGADYLYRVNTPHAWYFLALSRLTFHPERASFSPGTPVDLVRRGLAETVRAVESRAEPTEVLRQRLTSLGDALLVEAEYAYRGTDWVARLTRAGRRLTTLADQLPRPSYGSVAAGRMVGEWLDRQGTLDLADALALLEDEWALFT